MSKSLSSINCNTCKIKKVKCGRQLPTCIYCSERGIICIYSDQVRRQGLSKTGMASLKTKIKVSSSDQFRILTLMDGKKNDIQSHKLILFQPILQPVNFVDECSEGIVTKIQSKNTQKFQTHILLILSNQIIDYDSKLIPQIDFFINMLEFGIYGRLLKFSINMNQDWIAELLSSSFEEKCITSYFRTFHPMLTYISKHKFYTSCNMICPVLKSVIVFVGYSSINKPNSDLQKYLKHLDIVQLKKNMFNVKLTVCQALLIFSQYLLFLGLGKQSLEYFHQGYLMASALGIDKDIPRLNEMDTDERRFIRFSSYTHDSHLSSTISIQPYYLFLAPRWKPLNPLHQTNPHSKDPNEFLIAECICLSRKCFNMNWVISENLMNKYAQLTLSSSRCFSKDNYTQVIYVLQTLFNYSLIRTLDLHLNLSRKCKNSEELEIVKNFAKIHVGIYHNSIIILNSQFSLSNSTLELDQATKKLLWSAEALYQITTDVNLLCLPMFYYNLCSLTLLYIKLILTYNHIPRIRESLIGELKQVYELFNSYRTKYNMPSDLIEVADVITTYYKIKVQ